MQIYGPSNLHSAQRVSAPHSQKLIENSRPTSNAPVDEVEISDAASFVQKANELPEIRYDRVAQIRSQIESGAYETEDKLDAALNALLDELV